MSLFIREDFISHAGLPLTWKVECDALTDNDYEALAKIVSEKLIFRDVKAVSYTHLTLPTILRV